MTRLQTTVRALSLAALACASLTTLAQTPPPYGLPITLEQAKKAMVAAEAEARKNNGLVVITIVDTGGRLVMRQNLEDSLAANGSALRLLALKDAPPLQGGLPSVVDGKIIGGIGVSGVLAPQDERVAKAGLDTLTAL